MAFTSGIVLLVSGILLVLVAIPRRREDIRPWLQSPLAQVVYPSLCLVLIAMGAATLITNLPW
jgi:hypothetical protein